MINKCYDYVIARVRMSILRKLKRINHTFFMYINVPRKITLNKRYSHCVTYTLPTLCSVSWAPVHPQGDREKMCSAAPSLSPYMPPLHCVIAAREYFPDKRLRMFHTDIRLIVSLCTEINRNSNQLVAFFFVSNHHCTYTYIHAGARTQPTHPYSYTHACMHTFGAKHYDK